MMLNLSGVEMAIFGFFLEVFIRYFIMAIPLLAILFLWINLFDNKSRQ